MEFVTENFHDTYILSVFENTVTDKISMAVDFPVNWSESIYERKQLIFSDALNYQVHEMPFNGSPEILEIEIIEKKNNYTRFRLKTNGEYREISCSSVLLMEETLHI
jgi:hypothetical protein